MAQRDEHSPCWPHRVNPPPSSCSHIPMSASPNHLRKYFPKDSTNLSQSTKIGVLVPLWPQYRYEVFIAFTWQAGSKYPTERYLRVVLFKCYCSGTRPSTLPMRKWLNHTPHKRRVSQEWALCGGRLAVAGQVKDQKELPTVRNTPHQKDTCVW